MRAWLATMATAGMLAALAAPSLLVGCLPEDKTTDRGSVYLHLRAANLKVRVSSFDVTFERGVWTFDRKAVGPKDFDQRMHATFGADGQTIAIECEARDSATHEMRPDLSLIYTRAA